MSGPDAKTPATSRFPRLAAAGVFVVGFLGLSYIHSLLPSLYDADAYFHLAVARRYAEVGLSDSLPWARFSVMHDAYGDKELLFHILLMPFASWMDPELGGRLVLALFGAGTLAAIAWSACQAVGRFGVFVPVWLFGTATVFTLRLFRLRPELLSFLLILAASHHAAKKRYRWLLLVSILYPLSDTAFHAYLGLALAWFAALSWVERRVDWKLLVVPVGGVALGLLIHPNFPSNISTWLAHIDYFQHRGVIEVGKEILPSTTKDLLQMDVAWLFGLWVLWRSSEPRDELEPAARIDIPLAINAIVFSLLYLLLGRFATHAGPFVTLALLFNLRSRGLGLGRWTRLPWRGQVPFLAALGLALLGSLPLPWYVLDKLTAGSVFDERRPEERKEIARLLPDGAKVAAQWASAEVYAFAAPQAEYLNVLDPAFFLAANPQAFACQRDIWNGSEPDIPLTVSATLASDYIAYDFADARTRTRLDNDPRLQVVHLGFTKILKIRPAPEAGFLLDWDVQPKGAQTAVPYPRDPNPKLAAIEAYVDLLRVVPEAQCAAAFHRFQLEQAETWDLELTPYGGAGIRLDGRPLATVRGPLRAVLGEGVSFAERIEAGAHTLEIRTCPQEGRLGFYLRRQARRAQRLE